MSRIINIYNSYSSAPAYDVDAQLLFDAIDTAGGSTTPTMKGAINVLILAKKAGGSWAKRKIIYGLCLGDYVSSKFNWKNPLDTDAAFRLDNLGGGTFDNLGYHPNYTNAALETHFTPFNDLTANDNVGRGSYIKTNQTNTKFSTGCGTGAANYLAKLYRYSGDKTYTYLNQGHSGGYANTDSRGWHNSERIGTSKKAFLKGVKKLDVTQSAASPPTLTYWIGAFNFSAPQYNSYTTAFEVVGDGLTEAEALAEYNAIQTFMTTLGIQE